MPAQSDIVERLGAFFDRRDDIALAYLFGSHARGDAADDSDVDVAVWFDRPAKFAERDRLAGEVGESLQGRAVDLVALGDAPPELAYRVIDEGILLYARDVGTRVEIEARILGRYGDYLPVLRRQRREIARGGDRDRAVRRYREALGATERLLEQVGTADRTESD